jgi:hypothetical protein
LATTSGSGIVLRDRTVFGGTRARVSGSAWCATRTVAAQEVNVINPQAEQLTDPQA